MSKGAQSGSLPVTLLICVLSVLATASLRWPGAADAITADADGIAHWQLWRWFTGPLVHATWGHLLRDLALLLFVGIAFERELGRRYAILCALGMAVPAIASLHDPTIFVYYGTSGLTHTLLAAVMCHVLLSVDTQYKTPGWMRALAATGLLALFAKVIWELATSAPLFPMDLGPGVKQIPIAHAVGAALGASYLCTAELWSLRWRLGTRG